MDALFEGGEDIRALATRVPSLYAESSNGRLAPRFYIRGLGNTDFDLAASQPVSVIVDEVVLENVILKSSPLFDIERVEVLRGPQGTLFGRNTPAGIVKFDTKKPSQEFDADVALSYGELDTANVQGAIGGGPVRHDLGAASRCSTSRVATGSTTPSPARATRWAGSTSSPGGASCCSSRPSRSARFSTSMAATSTAPRRSSAPTCSGLAATASTRTTTATPSPTTTRAATTRSRPKGSAARCGSTTTSTATRRLPRSPRYENTESNSLGDIDGGFGADFLPFVGPCPPGSQPGDQCIPFPRNHPGRHRRPRPVHAGDSASHRRRPSSSSGRRASTTSIPSSP